jgi:putative peptidoglycan lipid II flippase
MHGMDGAPLNMIRRRPGSPAVQRLGRSTAVMAAGTLLSRVTGLGRVFALTYALGATALTDTYTLANNTPNIIYELVVGGVLSGTVLPVFVRQLATRDEQDAWRAISAVVTAALAVCVVLSGVFVVVAPWFVRLYTVRKHGATAVDQLLVATGLLRLFAPQVAFYGMVSLATAIANARRRFAAPTFAPVANNLVVIAVLLAFPHLAGTRDLHQLRGHGGALLLLGLGTTAGVAAMALAQLPLGTIRRRLRWVWAPRHEAVGSLLRLSSWTVGFVIANQLALLVVQWLANAHDGDVTVYTTAFIILLLPHGVLSVSIMTAIAPELAERWSLDDLGGFREQLALGLRLLLAVTLPAAAGLALLANPIVTVALAHGHLTHAAAHHIAATLAVMALGLPAFSSWLLLTRAYQAQHDTRALFVLYLVENGVNIAAAFLLYPRLGVQGLALAFAVAYLAGTLAGLAHLRRRLHRVGGRSITHTLVRVGLATAVMALAVAGLAALATHLGLTQAGLLLLAVPVGAGTYLAAARLAGVPAVAAHPTTPRPGRPAG